MSFGFINNEKTWVFLCKYLLYLVNVSEVTLMIEWKAGQLKHTKPGCIEKFYSILWCIFAGRAFECLKGQELGMATGAPLSLRYHSDQLNNKVMLHVLSSTVDVQLFKLKSSIYLFTFMHYFGWSVEYRTIMISNQVTWSNNKKRKPHIVLQQH